MTRTRRAKDQNQALVDANERTREAVENARLVLSALVAQSYAETDRIVQAIKRARTDIKIKVRS